MAPTNAFAAALQSFWHTMTTNDRHATPHSPYRTGQHVPLSQNRNAPLTSVVTSAADSRAELTSFEDASDPSNPYHRRGSAHGSSYEPGMRSTMSRQNSGEDTIATASRKSSTEVQMQTFNDGLPPPPPVTHSWKRLDRWTEEHYEELWDNLGEPATTNDINELEAELDCTLPQDVRDSLQVHDGQERGGRPSGVIFGCMLLDCEEIVEEWRNWRRVNEEVLTKPTVYETPSLLPKSFAGPSSASSSTTPAIAVPGPTQGDWREELLARQDSQPAGAIQKAYTHPAWIPLARDWGGNCLAIDLAPGPAGKWGQVILFGRDYDCKYLIARSWAAFLATVADDMSSNRVMVNEETGELKLREFKGHGIEPAYIDILRWRADQKYGRKPPRKRPEVRMNPNVAASIARGSPYSSPNPTDGERGRSPHRFPGKSHANQSPRGGMSSPLARVTEEGESSVTGAVPHEETRGASLEQSSGAKDLPNGTAASPTKVGAGAPAEDNKENVTSTEGTGLGVKNVDLDDRHDIADEMKNVEI